MKLFNKYYLFLLLITLSSINLFNQENQAGFRTNFESCNCNSDDFNLSFLESLQNKVFGEKKGKTIIYKLEPLKETLLLTLGGLNYGIPYFFFSNQENLSANEINSLNRQDVNSFDRPVTFNYSKDVSNISDYMLYSFAITPALLVFDESIKNDIFKIGMLYAETILLAGSFPQWTKDGIQRYRPYIYNPDVPIDQKFSNDSRRSLFSGHTSASFSTAVFITKVFSDYNPNSTYTKYIGASTLLVASTIGAFRIAAGKHFYSDVLIGAAVGSLCGYLVPEMHRITRKDQVSLNISPSSINFTYKF